MRKRISRRHFLGVATVMVGGAGLSALVNPTSRLWRKALGFAKQEWLPPPPAPSVPGKSPIYRLDRCPLPSWRSADDPLSNWRDTHPAVDALLDLMSANGRHFFRTERTAGWGAPDGLISRDDVVIIKVNWQWLARGMTSTDLVRGLVERIVDHPDGFAGEVVVADNGQGDGQNFSAERQNNDDFAPDHPQSFADVAQLFARQGRRVSICDWWKLRNKVGEWSDEDDRDGYVLADRYPISYPKFTTPFGTQISLRRGVWHGRKYRTSILKIINVPVLKWHGMFGTTACVKNYVGVLSREVAKEEVGDDTWAFHDGFVGSFNGLRPGLIGTLMGLRFPDLNILDATYVSPFGNLTEDATYDATPHQASLLASDDPVALDYYASKHILLPLMRSAGRARWQIVASDPDKDGIFRQFLLASQARLLEAGHTVRFGEKALALFRRDA